VKNHDKIATRLAIILTKLNASERFTVEVRDIDFNDIFFLKNNTEYFNSLDVCLLLNGVVDVMVIRKEDIEAKVFVIENGKLMIEKAC